MPVSGRIDRSNGHLIGSFLLSMEPIKGVYLDLMFHTRLNR
jgi:hypothetical protein